MAKAADAGVSTRRKRKLALLIAVCALCVYVSVKGVRSDDMAGGSALWTGWAAVPRSFPNAHVPPNINRAPSEHMVPLLLHQSWKTEILPARFRRWSRTWHRVVPHWEKWLWTDEDNRLLVGHFYPEYLEFYDALPHPVMRADVARMMYLHRYGGVYADFDILALRDISVLVSGDDVVLGQMSNNLAQPNNLPNAFMASPPQHGFWLHCLSIVFSPSHTECGPACRTGPDMILKAVKSYSAGKVPFQKIRVLPPAFVYPFEWNGTDNGNDARSIGKICRAQSITFDEEKCISMFPDAYLITFWSHSWGPAYSDGSAGE
jgi:inositol phosphorylceramide mannosyltransferase catalytic subunit